MTRKKIVAGNWKMNNGLQETKYLINELLKETNQSGCEVMIAPSGSKDVTAALLVAPAPGVPVKPFIDI